MNFNSDKFEKEYISIVNGDSLTIVPVIKADLVLDFSHLPSEAFNT